MQEHILSFKYQARFYTLGELSASTRQIWIVLHGYGQLARFFISRFAPLTKRDIFIVAPEGLSRFYLESAQPGGRANERVGASWMTKENRSVDIQNYLHYLDAVYEDSNRKKYSVPVTILGFSQGAATASRWVSHHNVKFHRLILWCGTFAHDLDTKSGAQALAGKEVLFVYGKSDPYINDKRFTEMETICSILGVVPQILSFEGGHEIDEKTLTNIA